MKTSQLNILFMKCRTNYIFWIVAWYFLHHLWDTGRYFYSMHFIWYLIICIMYSLYLFLDIHPLLIIRYLPVIAIWFFLYNTGYLKLAITLKQIASFCSCSATRSCFIFFSFFFSPLSTFLIEGVLGSKDLLS